MNRVTILLAATTLFLPRAVPIQVDSGSREELFNRYLDIGTLDARGIAEPTWLHDENRFWYASGPADGGDVYLVDPESDSLEPLFEVGRLRRALSEYLGGEIPGSGLPFDRFEFTDRSETGIGFMVEGRSLKLRLEDYDITGENEPAPVLPASEGVLSPGGRESATIRDHNVWIWHPDARPMRQLTFDGIGDQVEWGSAAGPPLWSPDGSLLAVTRWDYRTVAHIPVIDYLAETPQVHWEEAPLPVGPGRSTDLYLLSVDSTEHARVSLDGSAERYLYPLRWSPDGTELYFARWSRDQKAVDLMVADRRGNSRVLIRETSATFVGGLDLLDRIRSSFRLLDRHLIWASEHDGWNHLYLHDLDGSRVSQLTSGQWPVDSVLAVDEVRGWVYFSARNDEERPYDTRVCRVSLDGGEVQTLTEAPGQHRALFSPTGEYFVDIHSSVDRPSASDLRSADGRLIRRLAESHSSMFENELGWTPPEEFTVLAADGETTLHGVLYRPSDFDTGRKYPVIEFMYAGPDEAFVPRVFGGRPILHAFAQLGFVVVALDARGTPGRGKAFQDVVYRRFGQHEIPDHAGALQQLLSYHAYMDSTRVGVYGYSWGGYFAVRALLMAPDVYHVGVAHAADGDLEDHRGNEMVIYMGTPAENPEGYEKGSNTRMAANLEGRLLLVQGVQDLHVPFSSTLKLIDALIQADRPYDLLLLPRSGHGFSSPFESRYALEAVRAYFVEHLSAAPTGTGQS